MSMKRIENFVLPEHTNNLYKEEAISSISLTKQVADKINELVNAYNEFSKIDLEWKQEQEGTIRKGVIYMKDNLLNSLNDLMVLLRDSGFIDDRIEYHCDNLKNRLDNIISAIESGDITEFESEMVDLRLAWNNEVYSNAGNSLRNQIIDVLNRLNGSVYLTTEGSFTAEPIDNGGLNVSIQSDGLCVRLWPDSVSFAWEDICADLVLDNLMTIEGNKVTITINQFRKALVFNTADNLLHIRGDIGGVLPGDIVLIDNGYSSIVGGELYGAYIISRLKKVEKYEEVIPTSKQFLYIGSGGTVGFEPIDNGGLNVSVGGKMIGLFGTAEGYEWSEIGSEIPNNITIADDGVSAVIKINQFRRTLVFNIKDKKLYIRNFDNKFDINDYVLVQNAWSQPIGGVFVDMYVRNKAESAFDKAVSGSSVESMLYPVNTSAIMRSANVRKGITKPADTFLFFTDPHLCEGDNWETQFNHYVKNIEETYKRSGASFIVCGGDWIGNSDTQQEACYKLAYAQSRLKAITPNYYMVLGNHDLNYQGVTEEGADAWSGTLDNQTIGNIIFNGGKNYYYFTTNNICYIVLDTGSDQNHTALTDYDIEQLQFIRDTVKKLDEDPNCNIVDYVILSHIVWLDIDNGVKHPLMNWGWLLLSNLINQIGPGGNNINFDNYLTNSDWVPTTPINVIGWFGGHNHKEYNKTYSYNNVRCHCIVRTQTREGGTPTYDIVTVSSNSVNLINCGNGTDYSHIIQSASGTITP